MTNIAAIYKREIYSYFLSPIAYITFLLFLLITGWQFSLSLLPGQYADVIIQAVFGMTGFLILFATPLLTMRTFAEEHQRGTMELLMTAPLKEHEIIFGKFLAAYSLYLGLFAIILIYPAIIWIVSTPTFGPLFSAFVGILLIAACFTAVGCFTSTLSKNQLVAAVISFSLLLPLIFIDAIGNRLGGEWEKGAKIISFFGHYDGFARGVINFHDVAYFVLFCSLFIFLTIQSQRSLRWR